jgi:hypothetical protein
MDFLSPEIITFVLTMPKILLPNNFFQFWILLTALLNFSLSLFVVAVILWISSLLHTFPDQVSHTLITFLSSINSTYDNHPTPLTQILFKSIDTINISHFVRDIFLLLSIVIVLHFFLNLSTAIDITKLSPNMLHLTQI